MKINMNLQEQIQEDLNALAKEKNSPKKELLKVVIAELSRYATKDVPDEEVIRIIRKMKLNALECGNLDEVPILEPYLPQMMSEDVLKQYLRNAILIEKLTSIGEVMQYIKQSPRANVIDKSMASKIARELLG